MKIVKNVTASPIVVADTGITIPANDQYTIPAQDYLLWAASDNVITFIGAGDLVINDGSDDLSISDGTDLIKGLFPNPVGVASGDDRTPIGHVDDSLKTHVTNLKSIEHPQMQAGIVTEWSETEQTFSGTSLSDFYNYIGSGYIYAIAINFDNADGVLHLEVDGRKIFEVYPKFFKNMGLEDDKLVINSGIKYNIDKDAIIVNFQWPLRYYSSVKIKVAKRSGMVGGNLTFSGDIKVRRWLINISKE